MPAIKLYKCNSCNTVLHSGWGGHMYVVDDGGERIVCPHPGEFYKVEEVLDLNNEDKFPKPKWWWSKKKRQDIEESIDKLRNQRTGFNSHCICLSCKKQIFLDLEKDAHKCLQCGSSDVQRIISLVEEKCPLCENGKIVEEDTGIIT